MRPKLTKADIIAAISSSVNVSSDEIHSVVDGFLDAVKSGVIADRVVELRGFGTFRVKSRDAHVARNPSSGAHLVVLDHGVVSFRPGRDLRSRAWSARP